ETVQGETPEVVSTSDISGETASTPQLETVQRQSDDTVSTSDISKETESVTEAETVQRQTDETVPNLAIPEETASTTDAETVQGETPEVVSSSDISGETASTPQPETVQRQSDETIVTSDISGETTSTSQAETVQGETPEVVSTSDIPEETTPTPQAERVQRETPEVVSSSDIAGETASTPQAESLELSPMSPISGDMQSLIERDTVRRKTGEIHRDLQQREAIQAVSTNDSIEEASDSIESNSNSYLTGSQKEAGDTVDHRYIQSSALNDNNATVAQLLRESDRPSQLSHGIENLGSWQPLGQSQPLGQYPQSIIQREERSPKNDPDRPRSVTSFIQKPRSLSPESAIAPDLQTPSASETPDRWSSIADLLAHSDSPQPAAANAQPKIQKRSPVIQRQSQKPTAPSPEDNDSTLIFTPDGFQTLPSSNNSRSQHLQLKSKTNNGSPPDIQRLAASATEAIAEIGPSNADPTPQTPNTNDLELLARQIYHLVRQRLEIEKERRGGYFSDRLPW
ncbi:MAG: hypothetical protein D6680_22440, partial [Cyanobacteria bacterium J007]